MNTRTATLLTLVLAAQLSARAESSGTAFLKIPSSARSFAMGRSHVVSALGAEAMGGNPANLGAMPMKFEATSSYASLMEGVSYGHFAAAYSPGLKRLECIEGVGLSVTRLQVSGLSGADAAATRTGASFGASDSVIAAAVAFGVTGSLHLGATAKLLQSEIGGHNSNAAFLGDLGLRYSPGLVDKPISFAVSFNNLGQGTRFIEQRDPPPTSLNAGIALPIRSVLAVVHGSHLIQDRRIEFGAGLEAGFGAVAFRGGYEGALRTAEQPAASDILSGVSGGVGFRFGDFRVDYAMSRFSPEIGAAHRLSVTARWGDRNGERLSRRWKNDSESGSWYSALGNTGD